MILEFDFTIHERENNKQSEAILEANRPHLTKQCRKVLELLRSGKRLTVMDAMVKYGISSLPRRILDLKQAGYKIEDRLIDNRFKEWWV